MATNPNPVFGGNDRVDGSLPAELASQIEGKSPAEQQKLIVQFYQRREATIKDAAASAIARSATTPTPVVQPTPPQPVVRATIDSQQFLRDPQAAVQALTAGHMTKEEFNQATAPFQKLAAQVAENLAQTGKKYWNKYLPEIRQIMAGCTPADQADPSCWAVAYNNVVGLHLDEITTEERAAAVRPVASEVVQPTAPPLPAPADLSNLRQSDRPDKTAQKVCEGLGIKPETYIKSLERINANQFPGLTLDNRTPR